jgi:serine/threonine-protein kinase
VVKVLSPGLAQLRSAVETFRAELTTISSLRHPNIAHVVEVGEAQDGRPFVVMERLEGRSLEARLGDGKPLPPAEAAAMIKALAGALQAAHARGVIHRELHPGNVFLAHAEGHEHGFPKILNFGIARLRNASGGDAGFGAEEARYMAPEQAQGRAEVIDGRTDQFALAAIAYRLLVGADAFRGTDPIAVLYQVVHEPPEPMSAYAAVDPRVEEVVLRGLSKRQGERFDTVMELARALEEAVSGVAPRKEIDVGTRLELRRTLPAERPALRATPPAERRRPASTPIPPSGPARPDGILLDEPAWEAVDDFSDLDRVPRQRGRVALFLVGFVIVCIVAALWAGWRPPIAWRQSSTWHALHLPGAVDPSAAAPPRPAPAENFPVPASPPPVTGAAAPAPSAPAMPGAGGVVAPAAPAAAAPVAAPVPAPTAAPVAAPVPARTAPVAAQVPAPAAAAPAPRAAAPRAAKAKERRAPRHESEENMHLRGVIWSDKEQRLVPIGSVPPEGPTPAPAPEPAPTPAPAPARVAPPAATSPPTERPVVPTGPLSPEDKPLPLSKP